LLLETKQLELLEDVAEAQEKVRGSSCVAAVCGAAGVLAVGVVAADTKELELPEDVAEAQEKVRGSHHLGCLLLARRTVYSKELFRVLAVR
jgi:hypothetical protein